MEFTTSDGQVISEKWIQNEISRVTKILKQKRYSTIKFWGKEFLEWFLDKKIEKPDIYCYIELYKDITEEELEQLEQLKDYLEL